MPSSPLRVAVVCSSNQNRSMEAHNILSSGFGAVLPLTLSQGQEVPSVRMDLQVRSGWLSAAADGAGADCRCVWVAGAPEVRGRVAVTPAFPAGHSDASTSSRGFLVTQQLRLSAACVPFIQQPFVVPAAHWARRSKRGFSVRSFGTGTHVKLPGPAPDKPNVYDFKTTYDQMYNDLLRKDKELYPSESPFQDPSVVVCGTGIVLTHGGHLGGGDLFDLILTCEERVYDQVVEDLNSREQETCQPVHVINVDIQDNHEEATLGAFLICELCQCIQHTEDMENEIEELLQEFEEKSGRTFLHTVCFY
ncbi:RNA polymerase II subunit A C-terminal domain phosphatase SSU72 [Myotis davidii]|uniref:protein-serine/threonine phosphatase n=1 Tax=Myotis davidii TaxID=225400 RepID=L5LBR2_MYODS|nr:RNA polymerase II subunit A C-terminal domain phosphatase SSU72 [Myotis davidii]